jgi:tetratricopeptide (TPR) repeat protein
MLHGECLPLQQYQSEFGFTSLTKWSSSDNHIELLFKRIKKKNKNSCSTIVLFNHKVLDYYTDTDRLGICPDYEGYFEAALIDKVVYNPSNKMLAILVIKEFTVNFANSKFSPYYGYHLYVYHVGSSGIMEKEKEYDKFGWGSGILRGNQNKDNSELQCSQRIFQYITPKKILHYLNSLKENTTYLANSNNFKITKKGLIDKKTNKLLNKHITTIPTTYTFYILKDKYNRDAIYKEVRLSSSQAQCYTPLNKEKDIYRIYNIYCYDRKISGNQIQPIFYIYNMGGLDLKKFTFDTIDNIQYSFGEQNKNHIIFDDLQVKINNLKTTGKGNIRCTVPGKDFFDSNFEHFSCRIKNLKKMLFDLTKNDTSKMQYYDISLIDNTLNQKHITLKTLTTYNDIAYYLQKAGANKEAIFLLEKIIKKFPNRTVAYYNLGDAYWELGEKDKAIKAYTTYIEQMCDKGLQKKIPKEVLKRVEV